MAYKKQAHIAFYITAFLSLLVALIFEKRILLFIYPFTFVTIFLMYVSENKRAISVLFSIALVSGMASGILLIEGFGQYVREVSVLVSLFYIIYLRLMYLKNIKMKTTPKIYLRVLLIFLPVLYVYDRVICLIYNELEYGFSYFAVMAIFMLIYIMTAIYYYLRNKNQSNLWMLIAAVNLGIMNIIVTINELYMYERMFTVIAILCSHFMLFFSYKFMLEENTENVSQLLE
ncbi:hypothetical protein [Kordia jejudonensis]|uniref:hypothetical protein n=1 Tax=Kordia jejudonensis TaxID=1348245 RepID=UPI00062981BC|nr:hypothetical protein [Kordia jejudonensis]